MLIPKTEKMGLVCPHCHYCKPKRTRLKEDTFAWKVLLTALDEFRERRKRVRFMKMKPFLDYLKPVKRKNDFVQLCDDLEQLRCKTLGMNEQRFYKLVAEFSLIPNGTAYYNPIYLFGCDASWAAEEFRNRIYETMYHISHTVAQHLNGNGQEIEKILEFIESLDAMNIAVEVRNSIVLRSKDWYCLVAFRNKIFSRGWTEEEARRRIKMYYRRNIRKVYPEKLLHDLVKGEFDRLAPPKKIKKDAIIEALEREPYYKEWSKGLF